MAIKINNNRMELEVDGTVIDTAVCRPGGRWEVTDWPHDFDGNQAITALVVTALLASGCRTDHPVILALRKELL